MSAHRGSIIFNGDESFEAFFHNWLCGLQSLLQRLEAAVSPENSDQSDLHTTLIDQVLSHYKLYYQVKASATQNTNAFLFFSPPWLTSLERNLLWLGDFKPSLVFRILSNEVANLTQVELERIERVRVETRREEKDLTETMARIQESVASPPVMNYARRLGRPVDGEASEMDAAMEAINMAMLAVLGSADQLRGKTVGKVMQVLNPVQMLKFLAAAMEFQLRVRRWGLEREAQSQATNSENAYI